MNKIFYLLISVSLAHYATSTTERVVQVITAIAVTNTIIKQEQKPKHQSAQLLKLSGEQKYIPNNDQKPRDLDKSNRNSMRSQPGNQFRSVRRATMFLGKKSYH